MHNIPFFKTRHTFLKNSFFLSTVIEWNKLDHNIGNSSSFNIFQKSILLSGHPLIVVILKESNLSQECDVV